MLDRNELRRLEKAAREKDKRHLITWASQFETQIKEQLKQAYEKYYSEQVQQAMDNITIALAYTALFSEEVLVDKDSLPEFLDDFYVTLDLYRTGEYKPEDYKKILEENHVFLKSYIDYDSVYKKHLKMYDTDLVRYLRGKSRKIVTIIVSIKDIDKIPEISQTLALSGYISMSEGLPKEHLNKIDKDYQYELDQMQEERILISDAVYVYNPENNIDDRMKKQIEYAKEHSKEVFYYQET